MEVLYMRYVADDGTEFDTEKECLEYENDILDIEKSFIIFFSYDVNYSYDGGSKNNIRQKLYDEIDADKHRQNVYNYWRIPCPCKESFAEEQKHSAKENSCVDNGSRDRRDQSRTVFSARTDIFVFTANKSIKDRGNKACGNTLQKAKRGSKERICRPKYGAAHIKCNNTVY